MNQEKNASLRRTPKEVQKAMDEWAYEARNLPGQERFEAAIDKMLNPPGELIQTIPLNDIQPFKDHPFRVEVDEELEQLKKSIQENGVMTPAIVRRLPDGGYQFKQFCIRITQCYHWLNIELISFFNQPPAYGNNIATILLMKRTANTINAIICARFKVVHIKLPIVHHRNISNSRLLML